MTEQDRYELQRRLKQWTVDDLRMIKNLIDFELYHRNEATPEFKAWLDAFAHSVGNIKLPGSTSTKSKFRVIKGSKL